MSSPMGLGGKVTPHRLRCGVVKDWDSHWNPDSQMQIPEDFGAQERNNCPRVVGEIRQWNNEGKKGMKNVPRKKPHHK